MLAKARVSDGLPLISSKLLWAGTLGPRGACPGASS
jgi:hypothetical protein